MKKRGRIIASVLTPYFIISLIIILICVLKHGNINVPRLDFILTSIITSTTTFSGFILSIIAIIAGLNNNPIMKYLKNTGGIFELRLRYSITLIIGIAVIILTMVFGSLIEGETIYIPIAVICAGSFIMFIVSVITSGYYLLRIIRLSSQAIISDDIPSSPDLESRNN